MSAIFLTRRALHLPVYFYPSLFLEQVQYATLRGHSVVASDAVLCDFIAEALGDEGYVVRASHDIESARATLVRHSVSLLICEFHLPGILCAQSLAELRDTSLSGVPVIILADDPLAVQHLNLSDIACCLPMPFELDPLLDCVAIFSPP